MYSWFGLINQVLYALISSIQTNATLSKALEPGTPSLTLWNDQSSGQPAHHYIITALHASCFHHNRMAPSQPSAPPYFSSATCISIPVHLYRLLPLQRRELPVPSCSRQIMQLSSHWKSMQRLFSANQLSAMHIFAISGIPDECVTHGRNKFKAHATDTLKLPSRGEHEDYHKSYHKQHWPMWWPQDGWVPKSHPLIM